VIHAIEKYEPAPRSIFSGSIGYISPEHDFDLNVVIRSIVYNMQTNYLSFHVGSAITFDADPDMEYEECLLKAQTMFKALDIYPAGH
jgi:para-aminobenzoate synthetase component 1